MYIIKMHYAGNTWYLKSTTVTAALDRATRYPDAATARAALTKAAKYNHPAITRTATLIAMPTE